MFPEYYHAHHSLHPDDLPFWLALAARQGGPVLELGCGTGRVSLPLARAGHHVFGLDLDPAMLAYLRRSLPPALAGRVLCWQGDLTAYHLARQFPLIICPCNTYSTLEAAKRQAALRCARRHLAPGGVFAFSMPNPELLRSLPPLSPAEVEEVFPHPQDGAPVQVSSAWQRGARWFTLHWHYDHRLPNGQVERLSAAVRHEMIPLEIHLEELAAAGLRLVQVYGDFSGAPYQADSDELIVIAGSSPT